MSLFRCLSALTSTSTNYASLLENLLFATQPFHGHAAIYDQLDGTQDSQRPLFQPGTAGSVTTRVLTSPVNSWNLSTPLLIQLLLTCLGKP